MPQNEYSRNVALSEWLKAATKDQIEYLCRVSGKSLDMLRQWASGRRNISAENAGHVASGTAMVHDVMVYTPLPLTRGDLCVACKQCPHFKESQKL
jgi:hypothetical protein